MVKRFLHPNKEDTPEDGILASRILSVALSKVTKEGQKIVVQIDGKHYLVTNEEDGMIHIYPSY